MGAGAMPAPFYKKVRQNDKTQNNTIRQSRQRTYKR